MDISIGPYERRKGSINHPGQRRTAERLRCGREKWAEIGAEIIPEGVINAGQSLSHGCAVPAPFTQGSLALQGTGNIGVVGSPQHRAAESSAPTKRRDSCRNHPSQRRAAKRPRPRPRGMGRNRRKDHPKRGTASATARAALSEAESAERAAGQIRFLPDDLRVQHGAQRSEVSAKLRPCSRRDCDN